jgi:hypothetical protein
MALSAVRGDVVTVRHGVRPACSPGGRKKGMDMLSRFIVGVALALTLVLGVTSVSALADNPPGTGQPGAECEEIRPGHASSAPGSAFNEDGHAGTVYAGEQPQNSKNPHSVSQYDTACFQQEQHRS